MGVVRSFCYFHTAVEEFCTAGCVGVYLIGCRLFHVVLAVFFAIVGITIGAIAGTSIGLKSRGGIMHCDSVRAIIGSIFVTSILNVSSQDSDSEDTSYAWILPWVDSMAILAVKLVHDYYAGALERPGKGNRAEKSVDELSINLTDEPLGETDCPVPSASRNWSSHGCCLTVSTHFMRIASKDGFLTTELVLCVDVLCRDTIKKS